jgi:hypothetical protein
MGELGTHSRLAEGGEGKERVQCTSCASADLSQSSVQSICAEPSGLIPFSRMQMHIDEAAFCGRCYTRRCVGMQTGCGRR